jgi:hypothetical protein
MYHAKRSVESRAHGCDDVGMSRGVRVSGPLPPWKEHLDIAREQAGTKHMDEADVMRYVAFARRMRKARDEHDPYWSLRTLAGHAKIDIGSLHRIENGKRPHLAVHSFLAICEALGMHPLWAWFGDTRYKDQEWHAKTEWTDVQGRIGKVEAPPASRIVRKRPAEKSG